MQVRCLVKCVEMHDATGNGASAFCTSTLLPPHTDTHPTVYTAAAPVLPSSNSLNTSAICEVVRSKPSSLCIDTRKNCSHTATHSHTHTREAQGQLRASNNRGSTAVQSASLAIPAVRPTTTCGTVGWLFETVRCLVPAARCQVPWGQHQPA